MIKRDNLVKIGKFNKPHGVKGELSFTFTNTSFDEIESPFFICDMDGIFVPFKLEEYRFTSNSNALVKLKNINSDINAKAFTNKEVYFPKADIVETPEDEDFTWDYFIGFTLIDKQMGEIGVVADVDQSTINTLFVVENQENDELLIPATEEMITHIDEEQKRIYLDLPEGLLE